MPMEDRADAMKASEARTGRLAPHCECPRDFPANLAKSRAMLIPVNGHG
jgi:hypothetical protein